METPPTAALHNYGTLLLAARLRKVSETFYAGVDAVYRDHGVELPARCFPILFLLRDRGRLGISELAQQLGQTHPAVSQMSRKLLQHGVVREWTDPRDDRRRLLGLSRRGTMLMTRLQPVWQAIIEAVAELEVSHPLSGPLTAIDAELGGRDFASRIRSRLGEAGTIEIVPFSPRYASDFKRLNLEWLERYFRIEPIDEQMLSRPQQILRDGGAIFCARLRKQIVGTCALINEGGGRYELAKMAVTAEFQGRGIGRDLLAAAIDAFTVRDGHELFLQTNSILGSAVALYESAGFVHTPRPSPPAYERSNVYMVYRSPQIPGEPPRAPN